MQVAIFTFLQPTGSVPRLATTIPAATDPKQAFYSVAAQILFGLLITGLAVEASRAYSANGGPVSARQLALFTRGGADRRPWRAYAAVGLIVVTLLGELGAIADLVGGTAPAWIQWLVLVCLCVALLGVTWLVYDVVFAQAGLEGRRVSALLAAGLLAMGAGYGVIRILVTGKQYISPLSGPFRVGGTCADLTCGLRQHIAPTTESTHVNQLPEGSIVHVRCQTLGGPVHLKHGSASSSVWDLLSDGYYVSDLFLNTTGYGTFDPLIQRCPGSPTTPHTGGPR
jgi:hypothetical protein